jgi:FG-GAP repeat protein
MAPGVGARTVAVADLNHDGLLDLAVANLPSGNVSVLLGTGTGRIPIQVCEAGNGLRIPTRPAATLRADRRFGALLRRMGLVPGPASSP